VVVVTIDGILSVHFRFGGFVYFVVSIVAIFVLSILLLIQIDMLMLTATKDRRLGAVTSRQHRINLSLGHWR